MKLNKNSWHAKYYKFFWNTKTLPNNLCEYFWGLLGAIILIIPFWTSLLLCKTDKEKNGIRYLTFSLLLSTGSILIGASILEEIGWEIENKIVLGFVYQNIGFIGLTTIVCLSMCVIIPVIMMFSKLKPKRRSTKQTIISEYIKNIKEKSCTLIEWGDDNRPNTSL